MDALFSLLGISPTSLVMPSVILLESALLVLIIYVLFAQEYNPKKPTDDLSDQEVQQLINEWNPESLVTPETNDHTLPRDSEFLTVTSSPAARIQVNGKTAINMGSMNFLGLTESGRVKEAAIATVRKYGVGSCGPRGFYGTIDTHLHLERALASLMGTPEATIYSSWYSTMMSVIPAFSQREDYLFVDKAISFPAQVGLGLSRSRVIWFEHNNTADLEQRLSQWRPALQQQKHRSFVVIEGVYAKTGDLAPLPAIMELKRQFCFRLILDDSFGIGTLGQTGRGTCEHYGINPAEVDLLCGNLGAALASSGGFCCSSAIASKHQRLNSSGYVFSASSPPYQMTAAREAIDVMLAQPELLARLTDNTRRLRAGLAQIPGITVLGDAIAAVIPVKLACASARRLDDERTIQSIVDKALDAGVAIARSKYSAHEMHIPEPNFRLMPSAAHTSDDIATVVRVVTAAVRAALHELPVE